MKIKDVVASAGLTGFYFDDQKAIKSGAEHDGMFYEGAPLTEGFKAVRQPGESISVMLILEDDSVAKGDCAAVQYSGAGGRDPLFLANDFIPIIEGEIKKLLVGEDVSKFRPLAEKVDGHLFNGKKLHTAIRYGVTQAILNAASISNKITMAEVVRNEYAPDKKINKVPIFAQSGDDRYLNADKMIIKKASVLPHGLFNNVKDKTGEKGEKLLDYVKWLRKRVLDKRQSSDYNPVFHIDVYGTIGDFTNNDLEKMVSYFRELEKAANPFSLRIEGPVDIGEREAQIKLLSDLTKRLDEEKINVEIVADEWCNTLEDVIDFAKAGAGHMIQIKTPDLGGVNNTIEAVLECRKYGVKAYCGGSCNETNLSAEILVNCSMGIGADQQLAKPGMGVDEGIMIVENEMNRTMRLIQRTAE